MGKKKRRYCEGTDIAEDVCSFSDDGKTLLRKRNNTYACGKKGGEKCDPLTAVCTTHACNDRFRNYCKITSNDNVCATYENVGYCLHEDAGCSSATVGQTKEICTGEIRNGYPALMRYQCIKIDDADASGTTAIKYVWAKLDSGSFKTCPLGCANDACIGEIKDGDVACSAEQSAFCARLNPECKCTNSGSGFGNCYYNYKEIDENRGWNAWSECKNGISYNLQEIVLMDGDGTLATFTFVNVGQLCRFGCHFNGACMNDKDYGATTAIKCADKQNCYEWDAETETFGATAKSFSKYCYDNRCVNSICGDGITEGWEECDAGPFDDDESWETRWEKARAVGCTPKCRISISGCGTSIIEDGEECDHGTMNGTDASYCTDLCKIIKIN